MSTVPLIIAEMPVPEPPPDTATAMSALTSRYASAQAWATLTRVSEPLFWIDERLFAAEVPPPQEEAPRTAADSRTVVGKVFMVRILFGAGWGRGGWNSNGPLSRVGWSLVPRGGASDARNDSLVTASGG